MCCSLVTAGRYVLTVNILIIYAFYLYVHIVLLFIIQFVVAIDLLWSIEKEVILFLKRN